MILYRYLANLNFVEVFGGSLASFQSIMSLYGL